MRDLLAVLVHCEKRRKTSFLKACCVFMTLIPELPQPCISWRGQKASVLPYHYLPVASRCLTFSSPLSTHELLSSLSSEADFVKLLVTSLLPSLMVSSLFLSY